jgi:hypothetical protein
MNFKDYYSKGSFARESKSLVVILKGLGAMTNKMA